MLFTLETEAVQQIMFNSIESKLSFAQLPNTPILTEGIRTLKPQFSGSCNLWVGPNMRGSHPQPAKAVSPIMRGLSLVVLGGGRSLPAE
jgi:hypothetical protein